MVTGVRQEIYVRLDDYYNTHKQKIPALEQHFPDRDMATFWPDAFPQSLLPSLEPTNWNIQKIKYFPFPPLWRVEQRCAPDSPAHGKWDFCLEKAVLLLSVMSRPVPSSPSPPSRAHPASRHASPFSWMWGLEESKPHLSQMQWRPLWQILPCFTSHEHVLMSPSKNPPQLLLCWSKLSFGLLSVNEASAQGEFGTTAPYLHDMQMAVDMTFPPVANITGNVNWQPRAQRCFSPHPINASETFCKAEILAHGPTLKSVSEL